MTVDDFSPFGDITSGDVTAGSIVATSVLGSDRVSPAGDPTARLRAADADRRASMIRVAEHAAEIGLESAPALAAAAGIAPRPEVPPAPARRPGTLERLPSAQRSQVVQRPRMVQRSQMVQRRLTQPPRSTPPAVGRRINPVVVALVVVAVLYLLVRVVG